jgi:MFS family permease
MRLRLHATRRALHLPLHACTQIVSSTLAGAALGSLSGGSLADSLGRRKALLLAAIPMLLGPLLSANAQAFNMMVVGRLVTGIAIGLSSALVPTYISEVSLGLTWMEDACTHVHTHTHRPTPLL